MFKIRDLQVLISGEIDREVKQLYETAPKNLYEPIGYALDMGGKRLRPVMVLLGL